MPQNFKEAWLALGPNNIAETHPPQTTLVASTGIAITASTKLDVPKKQNKKQHTLTRR